MFVSFGNEAVGVSVSVFTFNHFGTQDTILSINYGYFTLLKTSMEYHIYATVPYNWKTPLFIVTIVATA